MKFWKHSLLAGGIFMAIASVITFSSCVNDSCRTIACRNGGTCADEFCTCPDGFEGIQCETWSRDKFIGFYDGITKIDSLPVNIDSAVISKVFGSPSHTEAQVFIFSRPKDMIVGHVSKDEINVMTTSTKSVVIKYDNLQEKEIIEVEIDELVEGKHVITKFRGTKRN